jgi:DNA polymerase I-like protein with 3'-5' exonuclease and polymerase domains
MLVNADVKGLELVVAADWYNDTTLKQEILEKKNTHADNQARFKLPNRLVAKRFVFKLIYGATAYGYYSDSDFIEVGFSSTKWQTIIDEFYTKYQGIAKGHQRDIRFVRENGYLEIPSGRVYSFKPRLRRGEWEWPLTQIKNYPIQGFGAELVMLFRIMLYQMLKETKIVFKVVQTVHDSVVVDTPKENILLVAKIMHEAIAKVPEMCYNYWSYQFSLPLTIEIQVGLNKKEMTEWH